MKTELISTPHLEEKITQGKNQEADFAFSQIIGSRDTQDDALTWVKFSEQELEKLSPDSLGERLWTTFHHLHNQYTADIYNLQGTTAATVIVQNDSLIIGSIGDSAAFLVAYDRLGQIEKVIRLNSKIHKPDNDYERIRITKAGGSISSNRRVNGQLAVSRAIGDKQFKGVAPDATVDIYNLSCMNAGKLQVIVTSDGFTDFAAGNDKAAHENFLKECLQEINIECPASVQEDTMALFLTEKIKLLGIEQNIQIDNTSIAVQTIRQKTLPDFQGIVGVYDGHGKHGEDASPFVAKNIHNEFLKLLALSDNDYAKLTCSAIHKREADDRIFTALLPEIAQNTPEILSSEFMQKFLNQAYLLWRKADDLRDRDAEAAQAAVDLALELLQQSKMYYQGEDGIKLNAENFVNNCQQAINKARPILEAHRGIKVILVTLGKLFEILGIFWCAPNLKPTFFPPTKSALILNDLQMQISSAVK